VTTAPAGPHAPPPPLAPRWMTLVLRAAAIYNVAWGAFAIVFPSLFWEWIGMTPPNYPFLWQCIGMIVGVYGVGYWIAASDPLRHWPIVLVGMLGKIFGPIGFLDAHFIQGDVPLRFGVTLLTNDLLWWAPFALILKRAYDASEARRRADLAAGPTGAPGAGAAMAAARTNTGETLLELSHRSPVLVIFLRHAGCTFCREALADVAARRARIEASGTRIALVHLSPDADAAAFFARYGLGDVARVSDPTRSLYRAFELSRGTIGQLFGWRVALRGFRAGLIDRHWVGRLQGDGLQLPGAFLVHRGEVLRAFRHRDAADRPDYCAMSQPLAQATGAGPRTV